MYFLSPHYHPIMCATLLKVSIVSDYKLSVIILIEDEELVTNAIETIVNLAPLLDLRIFSSSKPSFIKIT